MLFVPTSRAALNASPNASHGRTSALLSVGRLRGCGGRGGAGRGGADGDAHRAPPCTTRCCWGARLPRRRDPARRCTSPAGCGPRPSSPRASQPGPSARLLAGLLGPVGPDLLAVAAHRHVAPAPGPVAAGVIEGPLAVIGDARLHARPSCGPSRRGSRGPAAGPGRPGSRRRAERSRPLRRAPKRTDEPAALGDLLEVVGRVGGRPLAMVVAHQHRAQRLAQPDRLLELARPELRFAPARSPCSVQPLRELRRACPSGPRPFRRRGC